MEYDKQFSKNTNFQQQAIENIACSITIIIDETGVIDYDQQQQHNIVYNTLETKLSPVSSEPDQPTTNKDIIIGSKDNMDILHNNDDSHPDFISRQHLTLPPLNFSSSKYNNNPVSQNFTNVSNDVEPHNASVSPKQPHVIIQTRTTSSP